MARILLVEDVATVRKIMQGTLIQLGHQVVEAGNGKEALNHCKNDTFDLILTDVIMPEMEGLETIQHIRRNHPGIKIIAMSGGGRTSSEDYLVMAKHLGAERVLTKPFSRMTLAETIESVLGVE